MVARKGGLLKQRNGLGIEKKKKNEKLMRRILLIIELTKIKEKHFWESVILDGLVQIEV